MNFHELREWLGVAPADFLIYAALLGGGALHLVQAPFLVEVLVAIICGVLAFLSCYFGMRRDERVSIAANLAKKIAYPCGVGVLVVLFCLNFAR